MISIDKQINICTAPHREMYVVSVTVAVDVVPASVASGQGPVPPPPAGQSLDRTGADCSRAPSS